MARGTGLREGWYLMSVRDLEIELARGRGASSGKSNAKPLGRQEALAYRNAGNLPDELDRSLRLVLLIEDADDLVELDTKRRAYEPDFLEAPTWRRTGSMPVNVVPLGGGARPPKTSAWWEQPDLARLEDEWAATGKVAGIAVPAPYRGFVYKTVLGLQRAGQDVTVDTIADSIARWTLAAEAEEIRTALREANL
ncbi:MAG: hypothetical protein ACRDJV_14650 [Actinomycetota bacterium]